MALLQVTKLNKSFGGVHAVKDITFEVPETYIYGILGPNGSGKTTLFNLISGITPLDSGTVKLKNQDITSLPAHHLTGLGIARTFQNLRLFPRMTVLENILTGGHLGAHTSIFDIGFDTHKFKQSESSLLEKARHILLFIGLDSSSTLLANQLPYGAARRLEIGRALMSSPSLIMLDEPAAGMNPNEATTLSDLIRSIRNQGVTVVIIEHNVRLMVSLCDYILAIDHGEFSAEGLPKDIVNHPAVIESYIGTTETHS